MKIKEQITTKARFEAALSRTVSVIFGFLWRHFCGAFFIEITTTIWIFSIPKLVLKKDQKIRQINVWVLRVSTISVSIIVTNKF